MGSKNKDKKVSFKPAVEPPEPEKILPIDEEPLGYDPKGLKIIGKMDPEIYWKWRLTIEELDHAKTKANMLQYNCVIKRLEVEKANLELINLRHRYNEGQSALKTAKEEYDKFRDEIELDLKISLSNCVIDGYTYEIKEIEKD